MFATLDFETGVEFLGKSVMFKDSIDIDKGLGYLAGDKNIYIKIANIFIESAEKKREELKMFFEQEDFGRLVIEFHGLKSSSATIGSTLLPSFALELEKAGMKDDKEFIKENFDKFIAQYEDTCKALKLAIGQL